MAAEHVGESYRSAVFVVELVARRLATQRQPAPLRGDPVDVTPELNLLGEQRLPRPAVVRAVVRIGSAYLCGEFGGRPQRLLFTHSVLLLGLVSRGAGSIVCVRLGSVDAELRGRVRR